MTHSSIVFEACRQGGTVQQRRAMRAGGVAIVADALAMIRAWRARASERRQLSAMTERELKDIGLRRYDANLEINKPFWRA